MTVDIEGRMLIRCVHGALPGQDDKSDAIVQYGHNLTKNNTQCHICRQQGFQERTSKPQFVDVRDDRTMFNNQSRKAPTFAV